MNRADLPPALNFDPKRSYEQTDIYRPLKFSDAKGGVKTVLMPEAQIRDKTDDEIASATSHAIWIMNLANGLIDYERMQTHGSLETISQGVIDITTSLIATNVLAVYLVREDKHAGLSVVVDVDDPPESQIERDELTAKAICAHAMERTKPIVEAAFQDPRAREQAWTFVWHNVFSNVLFEIDDEQGVDVFLSMRESEQEESFDKCLDAGLRDYLETALSLYSQSLASLALDLLNPVALPIEKLRAYVGVKASDAAEEIRGRIKLKDASRMLGLFARRNPAADLEVKPLGDRVALLLPIEFAERFNELLHGAVAEDLFREGIFTREQRRKYLPEIARKLAKRNTKPTLRELSRVLGVSRGTLRAYFEDDPELKNIVKDAFVQARLDLPEE